MSDQEGQIVELGTHDALMKEEGLYQEMYQAQAQHYVSEGGLMMN